MAVAAIDLSKETADSLEAGGPDGRSAWRRQQILRLILGIAGFVGMIVGVVLTVVYWSNLMAWFKGNRDWRLGLLFDMGLPVMVFGGVGALGMALLAVKALRRGPPKAPTTPEETIRRFISYTLPYRSTFEKHVNAEAYLLLVDGAKQQVNSFVHFKAYWIGVRSEILQEVRKCFMKKEIFIRCTPNEKFNAVVREQGFSIYEAIIQVKGCTFKSRGTQLQEASVGTVSYRERFSVAEIGGRWYLTSPYWSGELIASLAT